jgi:hypothetical protein
MVDVHLVPTSEEDFSSSPSSLPQELNRGKDTAMSNKRLQNFIFFIVVVFFKLILVVCTKPKIIRRQNGMDASVEH